MALNKICVPLVLMLAVATVANARPELSQFVKKKKENDTCCDACICKENGSCSCNDMGIDRCPSSNCKLCVCTRSIPAFCWCLDDIHTCPSKCSNDDNECCDECECDEEGSCRCYHRAVGGCPAGCENEVCACTLSIPPFCVCSTVVDTCPASKCHAINTQLHFNHRPQTSQYYNKLV